MKTEKYTVGIIGSDLFTRRLGLESEFGLIVYNQIILALESLGNEVMEYKSYHNYRMGVFLDTNNDGSRTFELNENDYYKFIETFGHSYIKQINEFAKREQIKGTKILYQLNSGNISMSDFEDNLNP